MDHDNGSIPNCTCMAEAEILSNIDVFGIYLLHTINHINQYFQNCHIWKRIKLQFDYSLPDMERLKKTLKESFVASSLEPSLKLENNKRKK
jgi:hypothetical protein